MNKVQAEQVRKAMKPLFSLESELKNLKDRGKKAVDECQKIKDKNLAKQAQDIAKGAEEISKSAGKAMSSVEVLVKMLSKLETDSYATAKQFADEADKVLQPAIVPLRPKVAIFAGKLVVQTGAKGITTYKDDFGISTQALAGYCAEYMTYLDLLNRNLEALQ